MAHQRHQKNRRPDDVKPECCVPHRPKGDHTAPSCAAPVEAAQYRGEWDATFVDIPGGASHIGTDRPFLPGDGEGPAKPTQIKPFRLAKTVVTNAQFAGFVDATGYITEAERFGWSLVFWQFTDPALGYQRVAEIPWWCKVHGASWAHPFGPKSNIADIEDHPVTHVSWHDAQAFAAWMGGRLPTEAEWEHAARGGGQGLYPWGTAEPNDTDTLPCNIWQGAFPDTNTGADGYANTAPAESFDPNGYGLFNLSGNVWEWTSDAFRIRSLKRAAKARNAVAAKQKEKVLKGGSYLCHKSYCYRYRIAARTAVTPDSSTGHTGFRVALPAK